METTPKNIKRDRIEYQKLYRLKNLERIKANAKEHAKKVREQRLVYFKEYRENNKERTRAYQREYNRKRYNDDTNYKIKKLLRSRINEMVRGQSFTKDKKSFDLVGCSIEFFISYLESKFKDGMTWENHAVKGWHIDHIIPLATAGNDKEQAEKLCHYTNLQPLWWYENLEKKDKIIPIPFGISVCGCIAWQT